MVVLILFTKNVAALFSQYESILILLLTVMTVKLSTDRTGSAKKKMLLFIASSAAAP